MEQRDGRALMLTPLLLAINRQSLARLTGQRLAALAWLFVLLICVAAILLGPAPLSRGPLVVFALAPVVVAAIRFGLLLSAAAALVVFVTLSIEDDGKGLGTTESAVAGLGMRTMRFRAAAIGGRLHVARRRGGGTMIVCEAPQTVPVATRAGAPAP